MKQFTRKQLGAYLRKEREGQGVSGRQLAKRVGISSPYLTMIETAVVAAPSVEVLQSLARELQVDSDYLLARVGKVARDVELVIVWHGSRLSRFLRKLGIYETEVQSNLLARWERELDKPARRSAVVDQGSSSAFDR